MFDFFRKHTRALQFILVLLIFPSFVFFGIQGYSGFSNEAGLTVAKVAGQDITQAEWDAAHRRQVERLRAQMPGVESAMFDTPELRRSTLDGLVRERVLMAASDKLHLVTTNERLQRLFVSDPELAFLRKPDGSVDKDVLMAQGMSVPQFEERLRQDYSLRQVMGGIAGSATAPVVAAGAALDAMFQQREVQVQRFATKDYLDKINPDDVQLQAFYKDPANAPLFQAPEQAAIEYVVLDLDALSKIVSVSEDDLRKYYSENQALYATPEERRASHILIKADKSAPAEARAKAKARAESLLPEAGKSAAAFAELARKHSEDPGSAARGGDLEFFGRGAMVKAFEDVAFSLKAGETSGVVESDFGYHIIRVTDVRGGTQKPFEAVRAEIEAQAKKQQAQTRYAEAAEQLSNIVYEQADSLKPAAEKLKLELRTATVQRQPGADATGPLASPKLLAAVFGDDALRNKRNTEAVETGPNQMAAARVVQHTPARMRPFDEVRAQVREAVINAAAREQARKAGQARLAIAQKEPDAAALGGPALTVSRAQPGELAQPVLDAVLKADVSKLPAWVGVDLGADGFAVAKITKVLGRDPAVGDAQRAQAQYAQAWAGAEAQAYFASLKQRFKAEIKPQAEGLLKSPEGPASGPGG